MRPSTFHRINLIGAAGSGKSTLGRAIADRLQIPFFDSDSYYHLPTDPPFQVQRPPEEALRSLVVDLAPHPSWVLAGFARGWGDHPTLAPSLVVFTYVPPEIRQSRLRDRERQRYGSRIEPGGDMAEIHREFLAWSAGYDDPGENSIRSSHEAYLRNVGCPILRLDAPMTPAEQLEAVLARLRD